MGRIDVKKTAMALVAGLSAFAATGVAVAQGGIAANLALSGTFFSVSMSHLRGEGLSVFVDGEQMANEQLPVARFKFQHAYASNLCLSATLPDVPLIGESTFRLSANGNDSVEVRNLVVGATDVSGSLDLGNAAVGVDASQYNDAAAPGAWGLSAGTVALSADHIRATSVGAQTLKVSGVNVSVKRDPSDAC